jgi:hypothetical protein
VRVSREGFAGLRWLEGRWFGRVVGRSELLLTTRVANDTTLELRLYENRPFTEATDSGAAVLAEGRVRARLSLGEWVATTLDSASIHLAPVGDTQSDLTLTHTAPDALRVHWVWRDEQGQMQRRSFTLQRLHR